MKFVWVVLWLIVLGGIGFWLYQYSDVFSVLPTGRTVKRVQNNIDITVQSGKQMLNSWAQQIVKSGQQLLDQKKQEAEQYLLQQKEMLKQQAQEAVQNEAKKQIQWVFSGW